jgi:cobalt-zinc-cadmium efflux system outer membrane protein
MMRGAIIVLSCGVLGACASYRPAPVAPASAAVERARRTLPAAATWSTASLLAQAVSWTPAIRESEANYRSLAAAARAARVPLPSALQLTAEYSHDDNPDKPWLGSALFDIPLDVGGRRNARVGAADLATLQARADYGEAIWTTRSAIRRALIERTFADWLTPLAQRALVLRQDRYDKLQARVTEGAEARPISILAQIDLATAERRVRDVAARRAQADVSLGNALGMDAAAVRGIVIEPLDIAVPAPRPPIWRAGDRTRRRAGAKCCARSSITILRKMPCAGSGEPISRAPHPAGLYL